MRMIYGSATLLVMSAFAFIWFIPELLETIEGYLGVGDKGLASIFAAILILIFLGYFYEKVLRKK